MHKSTQPRRKGTGPGDSPEAKANHSLLRLLAQPVVDFPDTLTTTKCTYFRESFDKSIMDDLGQDFTDEFLRSCREFGYEDAAKARKVPEVFAKTIRALATRNIRSKTLDATIDAVEAFSRDAVRI